MNGPRCRDRSIRDDRDYEHILTGLDCTTHPRCSSADAVVRLPRAPNPMLCDLFDLGDVRCNINEHHAMLTLPCALPLG
eukprot:7537108-Pyramimonas_sp.AAC.1